MTGRPVLQHGQKHRRNERTRWLTRLNNPLQSPTNTLYLACQGGPDAQTYTKIAFKELACLSERVRKLLALKYGDE
jgi:hypothetical protein